MNDCEYFARFMITKKSLKIIKDQQLLYSNLEQFLNRCNGQYCFFQAYLQQLEKLYVVVIHEKDVIKKDNVKILEQMSMGLDELKITHNIRQFVDDCMIMNIMDIELLHRLNDYFINDD